MEPMALMTSYKMGPFTLSHRIVLAPMTRSRSYGNLPQAHAVKYYAQRATKGGLLISEATGVSADAQGMSVIPHTPGIWTEEQIQAWKPIVDAVHAKGAIFFCQIWHVGRASDMQQEPISSTHIPVERNPENCYMDFSTPRRLSEEEIPVIINQFRVAAQNARLAGFDGVELHAGDGYLLDQFMKDGVNDRSDGYGGSLENRCRFALEVVDAVAGQIGQERLGVRLSPYSGCLGCRDSDPDELAEHMARVLNQRILYLNVVEPEAIQGVPRRLQAMRDAFHGTIMVGGGYGREEGNWAIDDRYADFIVYGRLFLANPDLPERFRRNAPLNMYNGATFYSDDPVIGYTDYSFLEDGGEMGEGDDPMDEDNGVI